MTEHPPSSGVRDVVFQVGEDGVLRVVSAIDYELWRELAPDLRRYLGADFDVNFNVGAGPYDFWLTVKEGIAVLSGIMTILQPFLRFQQGTRDRYRLEVRTASGEVIYDASQPPTEEVAKLAEEILRGQGHPKPGYPVDQLPGNIAVFAPLPPVLDRRPDAWLPPDR